MKNIRITEQTLPEITTAIQVALEAKKDYQVSITERKDARSLAANRKMWACLADISKQVEWLVNGVTGLVSPDDWKDILSASLSSQWRMAQGVDGGVVMLGRRTSKMKVQEMCDLIEVIYAFGANNGVKWSEPIPDEYLEFANYSGANK